MATGNTQVAEGRVGSADGPIVDQSGRVLGSRALETRQRLLAACKSLLEEQGLRDLRVIDITRMVKSSPATFYQYFHDVEEAVLSLAEQATSEMPVILELFAGSWEGEAGLDRARSLVDAFIRHWDEHHAVLRVRNLASDEGDPRFATVRRHAMGPVIEGLGKVARGMQDRGRLPMVEHPLAVAAAMASVLERLAAYHAELETLGVTRDDLVETSARILHSTLTGER